MKLLWFTSGFESAVVVVVVVVSVSEAVVVVVVVVSVSGAEVSVAGVELSSAGCEVVVFVSVETALLSVSTNTPPLLSSSAATACFWLCSSSGLIICSAKAEDLIACNYSKNDHHKYTHCDSGSNCKELLSGSVIVILCIIIGIIVFIVRITAIIIIILIILRAVIIIMAISYWCGEKTL